MNHSIKTEKRESLTEYGRTKMRLNEGAETHTFLIGTWREKSGRWKWELCHEESGRRWPFTTLNELLFFIQEGILKAQDELFDDE